jgi:hypothetical protein
MNFDILIAGGGVAGVLAASRLGAAFPHAKIGLLEQSPEVGGRLRSSMQVEGEWGYGLSLVSPQLFDYLQQSLSSSLERELDVSEVIERRQHQLGFLSGGKLHRLRQHEVFFSIGAKILGGNAAANQWQEVWDIVSDPARSAETLAKQGKQFGKNPAATVLTQFGPFCGIADMWHVPLGAIAARAKALAAGPYFGCWEKVLQELLRAGTATNLQVVTACPIARARLEGEQWQLHTAKGSMQARWLLIAQSPWEAVEWLDKKSCHPWLWAMASQTTPTSAVVLVERIIAEGGDKEISTVFVPAEETVVYRLGDSCLTCQTIIDFENSLNSPAVVKAIKQLRRAVGKYKKNYPELTTAGEYLALKAVAWPHMGYSRALKREFAYDASFRQSFCGDAYGSSFLPDENLIESVTNAGMEIAEFLQG